VTAPPWASTFCTVSRAKRPSLVRTQSTAPVSTAASCQGFKVSTYGELDLAMKDALANDDSPSVIEVVVAGKSIPQRHLEDLVGGAQEVLLVQTAFLAAVYSTAEPSSWTSR
jgi:hypothetical protein